MGTQSAPVGTAIPTPKMPIVRSAIFAVWRRNLRTLFSLVLGTPVWAEFHRLRSKRLFEAHRSDRYLQYPGNPGNPASWRARQEFGTCDLMLRRHVLYHPTELRGAWA